MTTHSSRAKGEPPVGELLAKLYDDVRTLLERRLALFREEAADTARRAVPGVGGVLAGGLLAQVALVALAQAATEALARRMPRWAAAAVVGAALAGIGGLATAGGAARLRALAGAMPATREEAARTAQEAASAVKAAAGGK
ncbi:MAG TPA: phage holin family protein [Thermodesulfobacteriota bacterium]